MLLAQNPLLEGADGIAFDRHGALWVTVNEQNAIVSVGPSGAVRVILQNASKGPLEFPSALAFSGSAAYITNFDVPRRANLDSSGTAAKDGIGASIVKILSN